ncbi:tail fiber domain-containing protein [Roseibium sediminicola]|uniref:Peptidase S74 domain-containing protein n=1 Tax=Roseibium sediminicola TaxID=2933272 RepID=A0ABT0H0E8_9HYPH|nr:hypothetical protein [Roseibium sp. CAU 1639]MCK7615170.1 hypothetical protein [Roseibium sp. CAU 1639]
MTNGSTALAGSSTAWESAIVPGDLFALTLAGPFYEVTTVNSDTSITLDRAYAGSTQSGQSYVILRLSLSRQSTAYLANRVQGLLDAYDGVLSIDGNDQILTLDKAAAANSAVTRIRTAGSERWKIGADGNDDYAIKRSADGATFSTALSIARSTGTVSITSLDATVLHLIRSGTNAAIRVQSSGGSIYYGADAAASFAVATSANLGSSPLFVIDASGDAALAGDLAGSGGASFANKLSLSSATYQDHLELARSSTIWQLSPSTDGSIDFTQTGTSGSAEDGMVQLPGLKVEDDILPSTDNNSNLGNGSKRMAVIYAVTGTINTSDVNEKNWLGSLGAKEIAVAGRVAENIGSFQWLQSIEEKGVGDARIHFGLTAQAVEQAFVDEELDPAAYAVWCRDPVMTVERWTETETKDVDGEAVTVTVEKSRRVQEVDADGNPVFRDGLRHDQVMMMLSAAALARLDSHAARLDALEAA